jgi:hypothetical protein
MSDFLKQFRAARRVSTPLVAVRTPDSAATIKSIAAALNGSAPPLLQWDAVRGLAGLNESGQTALATLGDEMMDATDPVSSLIAAERLPTKSLLFLHNAQRALESAIVVQAVWNLRDAFKQNMRTLVLLCPDVQLPPELANDVLLLDEPLPIHAELEQIVKDAYAAAELAEPDGSTLGQATDALAGLAAFPAEQVTMMNLTSDGLDLSGLWELKRQTIEQTPGLNVWRGGETFADIGGVENIKAFLSRVIAGAAPPRAIVFIDEIEKALAGAGGGAGHDTSGVSQDQLGTLLSWMQDNSAAGIICIGPPGTAKSQIAKATGNEAGVPTIALDLGAMKGSLVGESEQRLRTALKVVKAMAQDKVLFIATCNRIAVLPPELRRRFTFGTFFFDLPTAAERDLIWGLYTRKYDLPENAFGEQIHDDGWTGAEIKQCCEIAYRLRCTLAEAAAYIVPVSRSAADQIEQLRGTASGRFISASQPGVYRLEKSTPAPLAASGRAIQLQEETG